MGAFFALLRYLGGAYLIWVGIGLLRSVHRAPAPTVPSPVRDIGGTFTAALLLTLGDLKAILFYASLFPVFVNLSALTPSGIIGILALTALSVGSVKLLYALFASRIASRFANPGLQKGARLLAGSAMIGTGGVVIAKT
jgi:threonine/homoserine/homoserine lactone efflux protein